MDGAPEIRDFLVTRRAKISPDQMGLPTVGHRRVEGLRRQEVADLAGVSIDYYVQIERGRAGDVSDEVLHAIARALRLNDSETAHLFDLARSSRARRGSSTTTSSMPGTVQTMIDAMPRVPVVVQNGRLDIVATNQLGRALYSDVIERADGLPNLARYVFFDPQARSFYPDWERMADCAVGILRAEAARSPYNEQLTTLIGDLATRSEQFRPRWAAHDVRTHVRGTKRVHHHLVGELVLSYEGLAIPGADSLTLYGYLPADEQSRRALERLVTTSGANPTVS